MRSILSLFCALVLALALAGCLGEAETVCGDGRLCADGRVCDLELNRCIRPSQRAVCRDLAEGAVCTYEGARDGYCTDGLCLAPVCGDGKVTGVEQCDGGNLGTAIDCTSLGYYRADPLGCRPVDCVYDRSLCGGFCGDGVVQAPLEECDLADLGSQTCQTVGFYQGTLSCSPNCKRNLIDCRGRCGDGVRDPGEVCDGPDFGDAGCVAAGFHGGAPTCVDQCTRVSTASCAGFCGDGVVNGDEQCDGLDTAGETCDLLGARGGAMGCGASCRLAADTCYWGRWRRVRTSATAPMFLTDIDGSGLADVWAVGENASILRFDGVAWLPVDTGLGLDPAIDLHDVFVMGRDDVWIGGGEGTLLHLSDRGWTRVALPEERATATVLAVWVHGAELWIAADGAVLRRDGQRWIVEVDDAAVSALWGSGPGDVWAVDNHDLRHYQDGAWSSPPSPGDFGERTFIDGSGADDVWLAAGALYRFDGRGWAPVPGTGLEDIRAVSAVAPDDVWILDEVGGAAHFDGATWTPSFSGASAVTTIWASDPGNAWIVGENIAHHDGPGSIEAAADQGLLSAVWALAADDVWAIDIEGQARHFNGTSWSAEPIDPFMADVWASGPGDVWAVGPDGTIFHRDSRGWSTMPANTDVALVAVTGSGPRDVWAFGTNTAVHYDGGEWTPEEVGVEYGFIDAWATGPGDVWALDGNWAIWHFAGGVWTRVPYELERPDGSVEPGEMQLFSIWASGPDDVWVVGEQGFAARYDGHAWTAVSTGTYYHLMSVWGTGPSDVWALAGGGVVRHFDGVAWSPFDVEDGGQVLPAGIHGSGRDVWIASTAGTVHHLGHRPPALHGGACVEPIPVHCQSDLDGAVTRTPGSFATYGCSGRALEGDEAIYRLESPIHGTVRARLTHRGDLGLIAVGADDGACDPEGACLARADVSSEAGHDRVTDLTLDVRKGDLVYWIVDSTEAGAASFNLALTCTVR